MKEALRIEKLTVRAKDDGSFIARDLSITLQKGKTLALVGESGCGKTTVCKAVMNLLDKGRFETNGSIFLDGEELLGLDERKMQRIRGRKVSLIVQNPMTAFNPVRKIGAQMVETLRAHTKLSKKELEDMSLEALEQVNLCDPKRLMESYPHTLSGGMLQRIVIALSLALRPGLILADEATTALDVVNQNIVLEELSKLRDSGIAILLVTHDFGVAAKLSDEICVMKNGGIIERGSADKLLECPEHPFTREFLSASLLKREEAECWTA